MMTGRMNQKKRDGFTLIELLVVVAIIGILAAILLPALGAVKERARKGTCKSTISNFVTSIESYRDSWGEYPPDTGLGSATTALLIYLDGDRGNGGPRNIYFSFDQELIGTAGGVANNEYADPWRMPYSYNELESENTTVTGNATTGDPRTNKINIHSFDIWAPHPDDPPAEWLTNYRD